jgi:hypothetical protein
VPVDDAQFRMLLEQVRELHRLADELTRSSARIQANVRARLNWNPRPPSLPPEQLQVADVIVDLLEKPWLSSSQTRQLQRAFLGR